MENVNSHYSSSVYEASISASLCISTGLYYGCFLTLPRQLTSTVLFTKILHRHFELEHAWSRIVYIKVRLSLALSNIVLMRGVKISPVKKG